MWRNKILSLCVTATVLISACGGSGSSDRGGDDASNDNLQGTAAVGAPIARGTVTAICNDGSGFSGTVTSNDQGNWSVAIDPARLPCALQISFEGQTLHSYAAVEGVANITPLTDLVIALASSSLPEDWFTTTTGLPADPRGSASALMAAMNDAGFSIPGGDFDPFTSAFNATGGDLYDDLLEALATAIEDDTSLTDYAALVTLIKDGNLASFPNAPENGGGIEDPEDEVALLIHHAGNYTVECTAVEPAGRGVATRDHARGSIAIGNDGGIDFDTGEEFSFTAADIGALYDRTMLTGDSRRIHINYDEDDSGRRIDIYLDESLAITEIRYQDGDGGRTRAAIGSNSNCAQGPQDEPELGSNNGASARENGVRKTYTGYVYSATEAVATPQRFNFNGKASSVSTAAGWNIQGYLREGDQSCEENGVLLSLFVGGTTNPVFADSCTINVTTFPAPEDGYNPNATIVGTFSGSFTVEEQTVTVTEGVFRKL